MSDGGQAKLRRARDHIAEASELARAWLEGDAFTIGTALDESTGRTAARVRLRASPPDQLALVIGDAVHNLRAALDHAVFDAARRHANESLTEREERSLSFPILATAPAEGFERRTAPLLRHVPTSVRNVIEAVQPYRSNNEAFPDAYRVDSLWRLHELDRIDKHRRLTVTAAWLGHQAIGVPDGVDPDTEFRYASGPVHDGQVLATFLGADAGVEYMNARNVVLVDGGIGGAAIDDMLDVLFHYVEWLLWRINGASRSETGPSAP